MKKELNYFQIGDSYGGNQEWFYGWWMKKGGCAAETLCDSCVYFARYFGKSSLYPGSTDPVKKEEYIRFSQTIKPYLKPRPSGVDTLEAYMEGAGRYFCHAGETALTMKPLEGGAPMELAAAAVKKQIDLGYPIPCLILKHRNPEMDEYVWHWFILNGYETGTDQLAVKAVTYSSFQWLDFSMLWNTGYAKRGGLILFGGLEQGAE